MESVPVFVPAAGETVSQLWLLDAVQFSVPEPELLMATLCAEGLEAPCVPAKPSAFPLNASVGVPGEVVEPEPEAGPT